MEELTMNKSILVGRLSADPEMRKTESGISVCRFTIAVQEDYKNKDGSRDVDFIQCKAWRSTADFVVKYFKKGSRIAVSGKIKSDNYDKNGEKRTFTYVKVDSAEFCGYNKSVDSDIEVDFAAEFDEIVAEETPF